MLLGLVFLFLIVSVGYLMIFVITPQFLIWRKYRKYKNVYTSPTFIPVLGDFFLYAKNMFEGKAYYAHLDKKTEEMKDCDLELIFEGPKSCIQIVSHNAHKEFDQLMPHFVDRIPEVSSVGQMMPRAIGNNKTNEDFLFRKRTFLKLLSFNRTSPYIPMMIAGLDQLTCKWVENDKMVNVIYEMFKQNFAVLTKILLGTDTEEIMKRKYPYKNPDDTFDMLNTCDFFHKTSDAFIDQYLNPASMLLPFLNKYKLVNPFKRNHENNKMLKKNLREAINFSKDENSVLFNLREIMKHDPEQMLDDLLCFALAGVDTSTHSFATVLYQL